MFTEIMSRLHINNCYYDVRSDLLFYMCITKNCIQLVGISFVYYIYSSLLVHKIKWNKM
uniref:Uncharacterized protein n=1 Tax=Anguilla anguilla TaxID=7936 RepID=A0A0E9R4F7_ANGAN